MNSAPENDTGRRRALVVGLSILIGVAGYWVANAIAKPSAPANVYGPKYGRDPDSQKIATSKAIPAKAGSGEAPLVGETQRESVSIAGRLIVGRVLDYADQHVPGCIVELKCVSKLYPTRHQAEVSETGHFEARVPDGEYLVVAKAPGHCMFPCRPYRVNAGGRPVCIYMHPAIRFALKLVDAQTHLELAMPYGARVHLSIGGTDVPANPRLALNRQLWSLDHLKGVDAPLQRSVVRVLGTETADAISEHTLVNISLGVAGLSVAATNVSIEQAMSGDLVVTMTARPLSGWVLSELKPLYSTGEAMHGSLIMKLRFTDGTVAQYWGVDPASRALFPVQPGPATVEAGMITIAMQAIEVEFSGNPSSVVPIPVVRGGDIQVTMVDRATGLRTSFGDVELERISPNGPAEVLASRKGIWSQGEPYSMINLPVGNYVVRAKDDREIVRQERVLVTSGARLDIQLRARN
jgi:hypothetical protein